MRLDAPSYDGAIPRSGKYDFMHAPKGAFVLGNINERQIFLTPVPGGRAGALPH